MSKLSVRVESKHLNTVHDALRELKVDIESNLDGVDWFFSPEAPSGIPIRFTAPIGNTDLQLSVEPCDPVFKPFQFSTMVDVVLDCSADQIKEGRAWMTQFLDVYRQKRRDLCLAVGSFLGSTNVAWRDLSIGKVNIPSFHPIREVIFKDYEVKRLSDPRNGSLTIERLKNLDGEEVSVHTNVRYYYRGERARVVLDLHTDGTIHLAGDDGITDEELDALVAGIDNAIQDSFGKLTCAITPTGEPVVLDQPVTWSDLYLNPETRDVLQSEVSKFFGNRELFEKMGVPHRRGLLLHGKPGTGKTMFGKVLVTSIEKCLFVWITASQAMYAQNINDIFSLARRANRAILFFEDLDMYAAKRGRHHDASSLGELMGQMDGMHSNEGIMVIATTNDLAAIEPALRDRPSRFDRVIEISPPNAEIRAGFLESLLGEFGVNNEQIKTLVNNTEDFTGAQLRELALVAKSGAAQRGSERINSDDLAEATDQARKFKAIPTGFAAWVDNDSDEDDYF